MGGRHIPTEVDRPRHVGPTRDYGGVGEHQRRHGGASPPAWCRCSRVWTSECYEQEASEFDVHQERGSLRDGGEPGICTTAWDLRSALGGVVTEGSPLPTGLRTPNVGAARNNRLGAVRPP